MPVSTGSRPASARHDPARPRGITPLLPVAGYATGPGAEHLPPPAGDPMSAARTAGRLLLLVLTGAAWATVAAVYAAGTATAAAVLLVLGLS